VRPVVMVGFVSVALPSVAGFQPERSVVVVVEPDVARKRNVRPVVDASPVARELVEWEYEREGAADEFANRFPDLDPCAVVPLVEYGTPFAARLAERYGLPGAGYGAARLLRDKSLLRTVTIAAGIANPASAPVASPDDVRRFMAEHPGRVVLKPADRQAAVGTRILDDPDGVDDAWAECTDIDEGVMVPDRAVPARMLAEHCIEGHEYSVEMLVRDGAPLFSNVTDKSLFPGPRPVESGHVVPGAVPARLERQLFAGTEAVLGAVGFGSGIVHCEWIVTGDGEVVLVECAGRFAGDGIVELIERAYGIDLVHSYYAVLKGEPLPAELPSRAAAAAAVRFLRVEPGLVAAADGVDDGLAVPGVTSCHLSVATGDIVGDMRSSWDRAGSTMACGATADEAVARAEAALDCLRVEVVPC
jgi:biotin carboxylase